LSWPGLAERLEGRIVVLEPLEARHEEELGAAAADAAIWELTRNDASTPELFARWWAHATEQQAAGAAAPFLTRERASGHAVGSTRFLTLRPEHHGLEIGHTWLVPRMWSTGANKEAKLLMLEHAFERLGCVRVEFKTDERNWRSRRALAALPAQFEGVFRKHMLLWDGSWRDSAFYSITDDEWPQVKSALQQRLAPSARRRGESGPD
jgi:RimJ/RimL family protein N-acetyltransferase